jgi:hypothetical protein
MSAALLVTIDEDASAEGCGTGRKLPVLSMGELLARPRIVREDFVGEGIIFRGGVSAIIGPPGTHKTRLGIATAIASNLGLSVGKLATAGRPLRWLILAGNENSETRYRDDLERITAFLTDEQKERVCSNMFFHVVSEVGDEIGPESAGFIESACKEIKPDVVVIDPLGDLLTEDNSDADMRRAIKTTVAACRRGSPETNPAVVFVHHARTGSANIIQAVGYDKGNFGKGSKALLACCRSVVNVAPADAECAGILLACGKVNDVRPFETHAVFLDTNGFYSLDTTFNLTDWQNDVAGMMPGVKVSGDDVKNAIIKRSGSCTRGDLQADIIKAFGVCKRTANRRISELIENGTIKEHRNGTLSIVEKVVHHAQR